jgi:hypothetical protein
MPGYGIGEYGTFPWGGGETSPFGTFYLLDAIAVGENILRLTFSGVPYFSGLFDKYDASDAKRYLISIVQGTVGYDGLNVRPVTAVEVKKVIGQPTKLDLITDRPFTPYPAKYTVKVTGVATGTPPAFMLINVAFTSFTFFSNFKLLNRPVLETGYKSRDFASPQDRAAMFDPLPNPDDPLNLGTFVVDDLGDYAFDEGITSFKKRVIRRIISMKQSFAHMPEYGIGIQTYGKRLQLAGIRSNLIADIEQQIAREPEAVRVRATIDQDSRVPSLFYARVAVQLRTGLAVRLDVPVEV